MCDSNKNIEDVIIIGAGAAGIAAFTKLLEYGVTNVKILEAEDRIGGRIHSVFLGDAFVDLGAEEIHGEKDNIVVQLAGKFIKKKKPLTESVCYFSDGTKVDGDVAEPIMELIEDFCEDDDGEMGKSIGEVFTEKFAEKILKNCENDSRKIKMANSFLPLCESFFCILEGPYSWFDVILESASNYVDCEGDQFIGWDKHGCKSILNVMMEKNRLRDVDVDTKIMLGKKIRKIVWEGKGKVQINCQDGSIYEAEYVIFTPSVGVLRDQHAYLFEPALPANTVDVLQKIGFCNVMKVALRFEKKWWEGAPFGLIWSEDFVKDNGNSWITSTHWLMEAPENPTVLVAWLTGPVTPSVEELSNDEIKNGIMKVIHKFLGRDFEILEPVEVIPTRWHSNPNFRGTYSYETLQTCNLSVPFQETLAEPLTNEKGKSVVLFAGEATHLTQYSTINGAILSGYREAERIVRIQSEK